MPSRPAFLKSSSLLLVAPALFLTGCQTATSAPEERPSDNPQSSSELQAAISTSSRTPANVERDYHRHPYDTLDFFGIKPEMTVVEIWPGGGWYTEILTPLTKGKGTLYAAAPGERGHNGVKKLQAANPALYGDLKLVEFPNKGGPKVPDGSADMVLTFRNVHNWRFGGVDGTQDAFNQMYAMLKSGGVLGVVEHQLPEEMDSANEEKSGYMKRSSVIAFAEKAGFKLDKGSDINANPKDTHDHPDGVWNLPPSYKAGDKDRAKYQAIGESDRMTLRFVKP